MDETNPKGGLRVHRRVILRLNGIFHRYSSQSNYLTELDDSISNLKP